MGIFWRKLRLRFRSRRRKPRPPAGVPKRGRWIGCVLAVLLVLGAGLWQTERRLGPLAQEAALSTLNGELIREINLAVTEALEEEKIDAGSILQEEKDADGTIENIVTDYTAANRVKTSIAVKISRLLEGYRTVVAYVPAGALFSESMLTGYGIPVPVRAFSTQMIDIQFLDTFDSAGINQTRQQLSLLIKIPIRIAGVFSYRDAVVSTEVPLAESVIIGTVPRTYVSTVD